MKQGNDNFREGSWVFYNNPGHHFHLMMFQIQKIVPMTMNSPGGYDLVYGARSIFAKCDELIHRGDPKVQNMILSNRYVPENKAFVVGSNGEPLVVIDNIGTKASHDGHEVVENYAGGKSFKYCRNCKVEVSE